MSISDCSETTHASEDTGSEVFEKSTSHSPQCSETIRRPDSSVDESKGNIEEELKDFPSEYSFQAQTRRRRLHVTQIPFSYKSEDLVKMFSFFGTVVKAEVIYNERGSKGFGFVTMRRISDAETAKATLHGSFVEGRRIEVNDAVPKDYRNQASTGPPPSPVAPVTQKPAAVTPPPPAAPSPQPATVIPNPLTMQQLLLASQPQFMTPFPFNQVPIFSPLLIQQLINQEILRSFALRALQGQQPLPTFVLPPVTMPTTTTMTTPTNFATPQNQRHRPY